MAILHDIMAFRKAKLILPIILIALMAIPLYSFFYIGALEDKYACRLADIGESIVAAQNITNSTLALKERVARTGDMVSVFRQIANDSRVFENVQQPTIFVIGMAGSLEYLIPYPCEFYPEKPLCQYYSSPQAYECGARISKLPVPEIQASVGFVKVKAYTPFPMLAIISMAAAVFLAGYVISGLLIEAGKLGLGKRAKREVRALPA